MYEGGEKRVEKNLNRKTWRKETNWKT